MNEPEQTPPPGPADAAPQVAPDPDNDGRKRPLHTVKGPFDFMGLPPHDQQASIAAIRKYFANPKG